MYHLNSHLHHALSMPLLFFLGLPMPDSPS
jgi:hypothetical protein